MIANTWVILLAAGEGRRLGALTADARGGHVPKQYCSFGRGRPMVRWALDRARAVAPLEQIVPVVADEHSGWWRHELRDLPPWNLVVQPRNRGTAAGVLLPLVQILKRDPSARVLILPSDHHIEDEPAFRGAAEEALAAVAARPSRIALVGIMPDGPETEYGWILHRARGESRAVARFVEKPAAAVAAELLAAGAVWNSFVLAASAATLLRVFGETLPDVQEPLLEALVTCPRPGGLAETYDRLPSRDFSREVLERVPDRLELVVAPPCGWTDLGTPARLRRFLENAPVPLSA